MLITFEKKFTEKEIDRFVDTIYRNYKNNPKDKYVFDLTELEWISNQELLVFTAVIKYLVAKSVIFEIVFFQKGIPFIEMDIRVARQLVQIWDVWKIYSVVPEEIIPRVFNVNDEIIRQLKLFHKIPTGNCEIYNRYGITPFISLEKIKNYNDKDIEETLNSFYKLNAATKEIVYRNKCEHPFVNDTLSSIVSKELYENFLDHFSNSFFNSSSNWAFMSLSLKSRVNEGKNTKEFIQDILEANFLDEALVEAKDFFWDKKRREFKNLSYLQFSFLDFGDGIAETLKSEYYKSIGTTDGLFTDESQVLKYAFNHDSSRHPIISKLNKKETFIPRGLFDILSLVLRYEGLMIVRSNHGKVLYDFANTNSIEEAFSTFGDSATNFPGTLISIYLPAISVGKTLDSTSIKPIIQKSHYTSKNKLFINIYHIINKIKTSKKDIYSNLLAELRSQIINKDEERIIYFSFKGYDADARLSRKILFFLLADYEINLNNNVVVIHPPSTEILQELNDEVLNLAGVIKKYIIHPLPFIRYKEGDDDLSIFWLGVYSEADKKTLNNLLFEEFSLSSGDFEDPNNIVGQLNYFDRYGNLRTMFPRRNELINYYKNTYKVSELKAVKKIIFDNDCIKYSGTMQLYLCNGNYYQYEFIELINLLNKADDCNLLSEILYRRLSDVFPEINKYKLIGITSSSHKILVSLFNQGLVSEERVVLLDNYHSFEQDEKFVKIKKGESYILVCDAISTGYLAYKLKRELAVKGAHLEGVGVIVDTIDETFENSADIRNDTSVKLIYLYQKTIKKYRRESKNIQEDLKQKEVIRINPFTNLPISLSIKDTSDKRIILSTSDFLDYLDEENVKIGFLKFNNVIHPYFFDTNAILKKINIDLLKRIFKKIRINSKELKIFYPKNSGMKYLDIDILKNNVFRDHSIEMYELERFNTNEGWKFPHTTNHFEKVINNKTVLIFDDGSCTGDSLIQMVDALTLFEIKEIVLVCLIGRVNDHKREFFSKITQIKAKQNEPIRIEIYFASHWHIPTYYIDDNPSTNELNWLKEVINLQNTPENIRTLAKTIANEITPKPIESFKSYQYLPKIRDKGRGSIIPKMEIIKAREEVGKVIGYRFYKESFSYFNSIIKKYESDDKFERNKDMELLCSTFLYEPYLYDKISQSMPDVIDKIDEFIDALIFGNPKKGNKTINIKKELTYEWDKKDIIHLFFIVFKSEKLINKLKDVSTFKKLIDFIENVDSAMNYVLYKILAYFPVNKNSLIKADRGYLLHLLDVSLQEKLFPDKFIKEVKIFRSFVSTLPSDDDYYSQLAIINENYRKLTDAILHKEAITVQYDILLVDLAVLESNFEDSVKDNFIETWSQLVNFIEPLLSFAKTFPGFFLNKLDLIEGESETSLRSIHGKLNDLINHINSISEFEKIRKLITKIKYKYLQSDCEIFKIFSKTSTSNIVETTTNLFLQNEVVQNISFINDIADDIGVDVPQFFLVEVIFNEILTNLRHRNKNHQTEVHFRESKDFIFINIQNKIGVSESQGGGNGLSLLNSLKKYPNDILKYTTNYKSQEPFFKQELRIKKI